MSIAAQIPRASLTWLLLAQSVVMLPHAARLSWWMIAIWILCATWRMAMLRGQASYPGVLLRSVLVAMGCVGIALEFGSQGGLDIAVALLILAFSMKLIEVRERRDLFLVIFLAYFIIAAAFLFSQSLLLAVYQVFSVLVVSAALVAMHEAGGGLSYARPIRTASILIAQAVPLMLVFFIVFPRIGPLWAVPLSSGAAETGMSDSMTPGDIAELTRSDQLVFRATFSEAIPSRRQLYWRAMSLSYFDGRSWRATGDTEDRGASVVNSSSNVSWQRQVQSDDLSMWLQGEPLQYSVTYESARQGWLYALPIASVTSINDRPVADGDVLATNDLSLLHSAGFPSRTKVEYESYLNFLAEVDLPSWRRQQEVALPTDSNPRSRALAAKWYAQAANTHSVSERFAQVNAAGSGDVGRTAQAGADALFVERLMTWFNQQPYFYTLKVPALGEHSVDAFFFDTRAGFCEHYASAFVFMLRSVGIPSRVVIGYQGGEQNPYDQSLAVRQFDAHAWAEVWFEGRGWQRFDPTAQVAPQRILSGLERGLSDSSEFKAGGWLSPFRYQSVGWLQWARLRWDAVNHSWQRWVVNFDTAQQTALLKGVLGELSLTRLAVATALAMVLVLGVIGLSLLRHRVSPSVPPATRYYLTFCQRLASIDLARAPGEGPQHYAQRIIAGQPALAVGVTEITRRYIAIMYAGGDNATGELSALRRAVRHFKPNRRSASRKASIGEG